MLKIHLLFYLNVNWLWLILNKVILKEFMQNKMTEGVNISINNLSGFAVLDYVRL